MRKLLLILFLASPCLANGPKYVGSKTATDVYQEFGNVYQDIANPVINIGTASSMTVTQLTVSTITASSETITNSNITGVLTVNQVNATTGTLPSFMVTGTTTNNDAPAGRFGEYLSTATTNTNVPATTAYGDCGTLSLTPGDWEISVNGNWLANDSTLQTLEIGVSVTIGNSGTGLNVETGNRQIIVESGLVSGDRRPAIIPAYRVSLSATTTHYLKYRAVYPAGKPQLTAIMTARRVR